MSVPVNALTELREARGLSVLELAERTKVSDTTLYDIEAGQVQRPRMATLRKLAAFFGMTVLELRDRLDDEAGTRAAA